MAKPNPAEIRGDIQRGLTRDKRPGFDPAAAPLETDAEAAGTPFTAEEIAIARRQVRRHPGKADSYADAMRDPDAGPGRTGAPAHGDSHAGGYARFALMIATATLIMFGLTYLNVETPAHVFFSQTRAWMAVLMGAAMAAVMLLFMWGRFRRTAVNISILAGAAVVFAAALWLVRSQATVGDLSYLEAMIPHHSIAILTSERARIRDPRVRTLADGIIGTQRREIAEMETLIRELSAAPGRE